MITKDILSQTEYRADGLGDVKPKIAIGGKTEKFVPNLNLSFECESGAELFFLNLNRKSVIVSKETESLVSDKLSLSVGNETDIWHIDANGRLKWDIEFAVKPATNVFTWDLLHTEGLEFLRQPDEEITVTSKGIERRPPDVCGSYAVYCNPSGHYLDHNGNTIVNYATGKLAHIYRPLCKDAKGLDTWADLLIEMGKLIITIPQKFFDEAVYPVTLDPTFGYETAGATFIDGWGANYIDALGVCTPSTSGTIQKLTVSTKHYNHPTSTPMRAVVYRNSDDILIGVSSEVSLTTDTQHWLDFPFSSGSVVGSIGYLLGIVTSAFLYFYQDNGAGAFTGIWDGSWAYHATNNPTSPMSWDGGEPYTTNRMSIYATYTEAGGATLDQEGVRFRNDDGDEAGASFAAAQDANITAPLDQNLRVRFIVDGTGDPAATQFQLEAKLSTESDYWKVN